MFSTNHFIWLALCAVFIVGLLYAAIKYRFSFKTATYIVSAISIASEICKIFTHIELNYDEDGQLAGGVLGAKSLPFHLCSILIFFILYLNICKNERTLEALKSFITPIALLGGIMAMLIPTSGVDFAEPYSYQCFVYHAGITWYAVYLMATKQVKLGFSSYKRNMICLLSLLFIMLWVNSILQVYDTNFFYLVRPPMDNLPVLNLNNGWIVYFISLVAVAFVLFTLVHIPYMVKEYKVKKNGKSEEQG